MKYYVSWITFLFLLISACAPTSTITSSTPVPAATPSATPSQETRLAWQLEWDKLVAAARNEGRVVLYTTAGSDVRTELSKAFKARYGVDLEQLPGRGEDLANKIITERRAGLYLADAYMAGPTTQINVLKPAGVFGKTEEALILPEVIDENLWLNRKLPFLDEERYIFSPRASPSQLITINTNLVKEAEIKSYRDLLNPKWKKNIVMQDPTFTGTAQTGLSMIGYKIMNWDFVRELARQEPVILRNDRLLVEWVAKARYPIGFGLKTDMVNEFILADASLKRVTAEEGTFLTSGAATFSIIKRPAHPNALKVFANWLLSREGQTVYSRANQTASARLDIPTNHLPPEELISAMARYYPEDEDFYLKKPEFDKMLIESFGPLLSR